MLFKFHYFLLTSGWCASTSLLGVFIGTYTDVSSLEIGSLFTIMPLCSIFFRPLISSKADRESAHKWYLVACMTMVAVSYCPFIVIPHLGPEFYQVYPRACWYTIVVLKVLGDIALSGAISVGDALAVNYTRRIGAEFTVCRVWGTISWMLFGVIIGQINEVSFLPKYTPAFMIMVGSALLDAIILWLWPDEYFRMVPVDQIKKSQEQSESQAAGKQVKSLMTRSQVLAHMRRKLWGVICGHSKAPNKTELPPALQMDSIIHEKGGKDVPQLELPDSNGSKTEGAASITIDKRTQLRVLWLLVRRDPRVWLYLGFLMWLGMLLSTLGFYMMGLDHICHPEAGCNFSQLAGWLQVSMAAAETVMFFYIKPLKETFGRNSFCMLATLIAGIENLIYVLYWYKMDPYYTLVANLGRGIYFGVSVLLMTDVAYLFANEVGYLLPELESLGIVGDQSPEYSEKLKTSLVATMQSITGAAADGFGRGLGSMILGLVIDRYSYRGLWLALCCMSWLGFLASSLVKLFDLVFKPKLGLDVRAALAEHKDQQVACA